MIVDTPLDKMTVDDLEMNIKPYGSINELFNFSDYDNLYRITSSIGLIQAKVFTVAMALIYKELGLDELVARLDLILKDNWKEYYDCFGNFEEYLIENGINIIESLSAFSWDVDVNCFDNYDYDESGYEDLPKIITTYFEGLLDVFSWCFRGPIEDAEEKDEDYSPEGDLQMGLLSSKKLGRYLYYVNCHPSVSVEFEQYRLIQKLLSFMSYPLNGEGYYDGKLIGDTFYIAWLSGYCPDMYDKTERDVDYYYPLYAYWLDKLLDLAYIKYPIEEFISTHPPVTEEEREGLR